MNTVLITGAAGFIGFHLSEFYLKLGFNVLGLDNYITGTKENTTYLEKKYKNFKFFEFDVCKDWTFLNSLSIKNLKYVFHLASPASVKNYQKFALETMWANSVGLSQALIFSDLHHARLIFSSTSEIYGSALSSPQKENDWGHVNSFGPRSCYDESKRFGEALIYSWNKEKSTRHGLVRIFNTYGPRMSKSDDRVINTFLQQALNNEDIVVYGTGKQTRSFCYIEDLVSGLSLYANSDLTQPVNLGNSVENTILELAQVILKITNSKSKIIFSTLPIDDPPQRRPDLFAANTQLQYTPRCSLDEGLKKTIDTK